MIILAKLVSILGILLLMGTPAEAQEARREVGPHEHGSGRLNIAIENNKISFDLDAPANDIVGFEHAPNTPAQKANLMAAVTKFKDATAIFRIAPEVGCSLVKSEAGLEQPEGTEVGKADSSEHADFNASAELECSSIGKLRTIELGYFTAFPNAAKLAVTIVAGNAQVAREASPNAASIDVSGFK